MVGGRSGRRGKCQTRMIVWRAVGARPNGRKRPVLWAVHRSAAKWMKVARSASALLDWEKETVPTAQLQNGRHLIQASSVVVNDANFWKDFPSRGKSFRKLTSVGF
jgi:hypothetical protein